MPRTVIFVLDLPLVSIVIPTRNSARTLPRCLQSLTMQAYPECKIELIVPEACSSDDTVAIAKAFGAMVVTNRLVTGEAGKALGARIAQGEYILFIDSDNVLTSRDWLVKMLKPLLVDSSIVASEGTVLRLG